MNKTLKNILIALSIIFALIAGVLYFLSTQQNTTELDETTSVIQNLRSLDQEWIAETVNIKSNPQTDFDSLASFIPRVETLQSQLLSIVNSSADIPENLVNRLRSYSSQLDSKIERLERFKTSYALLRNSVLFLPLGAQQAVLTARERVDSNTAENIKALEASITQYLSRPDEARLNALKVEIKQFEGQLLDSSRGSQTDEIMFLSHAKVILDKKATTESLYSEAVSADTTTVANELVRDIESNRSSRLQKKDSYISKLLGVVGLLVLTALSSLFIKNIERTQPVDDESIIISESAAIDSLMFDRSSDEGFLDEEYLDEGFLREGVLENGVLEEGPLDAVQLFASEDRGANESNALAKALADIASTEIESATKTIQATLVQIDDISNKINQILEEAKSRLLDPTKNWTPSDVNSWFSDTISQSKLDSLPQFLKEINEQSSNIATTAGTLSSYARMDLQTDYKMIDICQCIDHMLDSTEVEKVASVKKHYEYVPRIFASEAEILIIFRSVFHNVIESFSETNHTDGLVQIRVENQDNFISVVIRGNGKGMDLTTRRKVVAFLVKDNRGITGIDVGIKLIRIFTKKYEGRVVINSDGARGTIFKLTFPVEKRDALDDAQPTEIEAETVRSIGFHEKASLKKTVKCDLCDATAEGETFEEWMMELQPHYREAHADVMNDTSKSHKEMKQWMAENKARFNAA